MAKKNCYLILADILITRRLTVCHVLDGNYALVHTAKTLRESLMWCHMKGATTVEVFHQCTPQDRAAGTLPIAVTMQIVLYDASQPF